MGPMRDSDGTQEGSAEADRLCAVGLAPLFPVIPDLVAPWVSLALLAALSLTLVLWRAYLIRTHRQQQVDQQRHESLFENNINAVASLDQDGRVRRANPALAELLGRARQDLSGRALVDLVAPDERSRVLTAIADATDRSAQRKIETTIWTKAGEHAEVELTMVPIEMEEGVGGAYAIIRDVTNHKRLERALEDRALNDYLTGLPNRALFTDRLKHALHRIRRDGGQVALLFVDLDRFKPINDRVGHAAGDEVLRGVAERLSHVMRDGDTVARIGGDEFAVLLEDVESEAHATAVAERIVSLVRSPFQVGADEFQVGASIGIAVSTPDIEDADDLVRRADLAMYEAKRQGGFRHRLYSNELELVRPDANLKLESELRRAIENDQLGVQYQPIVDLGNRIVGFEALVRWNHPAHGPLLPSTFIPVAEKSSLIAELDRWVLAKSCREIGELNAEVRDAEPVFLSVNLSARHFEEGDFIRAIQRIISETAFRPDFLQLEITEGAACQDLEKVRQLKELGLKVAIDDFGTGFSSLGYLRDLAVDVLKVDKSFVLALGADPASVAIVRTILTLADILDLEVIVEGIEHPIQLAHLEDLGGRYVQGYYFGRPLDYRELPDLLLYGGRLRVPEATAEEAERPMPASTGGIPAFGTR